MAISAAVLLLPEKIWVKYQGNTSTYALPFLYSRDDFGVVDDIREVMEGMDCCPAASPDFLLVCRDPCSAPSTTTGGSQWHAIRIHKKVLMTALPCTRGTVLGMGKFKADAIHFGGMPISMLHTIIIWLYSVSRSLIVPFAGHSDPSSSFNPPPKHLLPPGWEETKTPDGRTYYLDHNTQRTAWNLPLPTVSGLSTSSLSSRSTSSSPHSEPYSHSTSDSNTFKLQLPSPSSMVQSGWPRLAFLAELYRQGCNRHIPGMPEAVLLEIRSIKLGPCANSEDEAGIVSGVWAGMKVVLYGTFNSKETGPERRQELRRALFDICVEKIVGICFVSGNAGRERAQEQVREQEQGQDQGQHAIADRGDEMWLQLCNEENDEGEGGNNGMEETMEEGTNEGINLESDSEEDTDMELSDHEGEYEEDDSEVKMTDLFSSPSPSTSLVSSPFGPTSPSPSARSLRSSSLSAPLHSSPSWSVRDLGDGKVENQNYDEQSKSGNENAEKSETMVLETSPPFNTALPISTNDSSMPFIDRVPSSSSALRLTFASQQDYEKSKTNKKKQSKVAIQTPRSEESDKYDADLNSPLPLAQWCTDNEIFAQDLLSSIGTHIFKKFASRGFDLNALD